MYILGISCYYHDSAAALIKDGVLIAAAEEERFTRKKHDFSFPRNAIQFCLRKAGITAYDLSYVVFYEKPLLKFERIFLTTLAFAPRSRDFFQESMKKWFFDQLWIKNHIVQELRIDSKKLLFSQHHLSHAASSFYCSPYNKAAVLTIDGVGEWTTAAWGIADDTKLELKEEITFPHSLGLLYSAFTDFAGFEVNEGEYKLMGLAPFGKPRYVEEIMKIIKIANNGSFSLHLNYFSYPYSLRGVYTKKFTDLFGLAKQPGDDVVRYYADIAASIQKVTEEILVKMTQYVYKKTGLASLCYAGGVALNSKANWQILHRSGFRELFIQPAAGDSGGALGAALWANHAVLGNKRNFVMKHAYYGDSEEVEKSEKFLRSRRIKYRKVKNESLLIEEVVEKMTQQKVIGWVQEEFEWGPRALGHRSILADPRNRVMKDIVNKKIKFREGFRPFAPSVLQERVQDYFTVKNKASEIPLKFMLYVVPVAKDKKDQLGAITHVDGTARPNTVEEQINPSYYKLIKTFGEKTGIPVILNTSFNLKGEPIVNTTKEAFSTFRRSGIDVLVINKSLIVEK